MKEFNYTWTSTHQDRYVTEEGMTASGAGDWPEGEHEPDWIAVRERKSKRWRLKGRTSGGWLEETFATVKDAKKYVHETTNWRSAN